MSQQGAYQQGSLVPDLCSRSLQATGLLGQCRRGRGRKSPTNIGAVACPKATGLGVQKEIQRPRGQELRRDVISEAAASHRER